MDIRLCGLQFVEEANNLGATEQIIAGARMDLTIL
jgi:hypothetical protein